MKPLFLAAAAVVAATASSANEFEPAIRSYLEAEIMAWASNPVLVDAIRAQNREHAGLSQADIDALDQTWRAEVGTDGSGIIGRVIENAAAEFLRGRVDAAGGMITEVFIMDAHGLNVAASAVTSDYWQGDEAKFSETYPRGAGAVHISEVEFDESSQTYQSQVSVAIVDPATSEVVGAMTVGLNAEAFF